MVDCLGLPTCHRTQAGTGVRPDSQRQTVEGTPSEEIQHRAGRRAGTRAGAAEAVAQAAEAGGFATAAVPRAKARRGAATPPPGVRSGSQAPTSLARSRGLGSFGPPLLPTMLKAAARSSPGNPRPPEGAPSAPAHARASTTRFVRRARLLCGLSVGINGKPPQPLSCSWLEFSRSLRPA
jgi:hypothetical protein